MGKKSFNKVFKEKQRELISEREEKDQDFSSRRKLIFGLLTVVFISRVIYAITQFVFLKVYDFPTRSREIPMLIFMIAFLFLFCIMIYSTGFKPAVYLVLAGGLWSLLNAYRFGIFFMLNTAVVFINARNIIFVTTIFLQIFVALFILVNKKSRGYMDSMAMIRTNMVTWWKDYLEKAKEGDQVTPEKTDEC